MIEPPEPLRENFAALAQHQPAWISQRWAEPTPALFVNPPNFSCI
jgi:hypothetical protein